MCREKVDLGICYKSIVLTEFSVLTFMISVNLIIFNLSDLFFTVDNNQRQGCIIVVNTRNNQNLSQVDLESSTSAHVSSP